VIKLIKEPKQKVSKETKINQPRKNEYQRDYRKASVKEQVDAVFRRAGLPEELKKHMESIPKHLKEFYLS